MRQGSKGSFEDLASWLGRESEAPDFRSRLTTLLLELCALRSIPGESVAEAALEERAVFNALTAAMRGGALPGRIEMRGVDEKIAEDWRYTKPYYTTDNKPYLGRCNLLHLYEPDEEGPIGPSLALNAHIDTVAPYFIPSVKDGVLYGRGACDDKGSCVAILGASMLLEKLRKSLGIAPRGRIVSMYAIDEESGGNGSLALAADPELSALYDTIIVAESTQGQIHASNRGAVWYKVELGPETRETTAFALKIVRAFEKLGRSLRSESEHPQFPAKPVQTCHGILGKYGEHPSRICGHIEFSISGERLTLASVADSAEKGLAEYIAEYTDRTKSIDPLTGKPRLGKHYDLQGRGDDILLTVYGNTGHMGSSLENDNAITKASFIVPEIQKADVGRRMRLAQTGEEPFILEGGQGFLPSHSIEQIKSRMQGVLSALYENEKSVAGYPGPLPRLSFDKLHNEAFARDPDSAEARKAIKAARGVGIKVDVPLLGFPVSCDARLFASFHPDKQVFTAGPGFIRFAHADNEHIDMAELARSSAFYALYALSLTGAIDKE